MRSCDTLSQVQSSAIITSTSQVHSSSGHPGSPTVSWLHPSGVRSLGGFLQGGIGWVGSDVEFNKGLRTFKMT